jgi:putative membrane protein
MSRHLQLAVGFAVALASTHAFAETAEYSHRTTQWTWPAYIAVSLFAIALLYVAGLLRMKLRGARLRPLPMVCFAGGWLSLLLALDSPLHEISEQLFWVHMTQHEILILISAPLLVLSQPAAPLLLALPEGWRIPVAKVGKMNGVHRLWALMSAPLAAWILHALALWAWHAPRLFVAALQSDFVHAAQHISFFGTALLFWWSLFHAHGGRLGYGGAIVYVFTTAIHTSVLGAWLTFAPTVWYPPYVATAPLWGLTALEDQQVGGLIMWIPAGTLLTIVGLVLLTKWLSHSQERWEYTRTAELIRASQGVAE